MFTSHTKFTTALRPVADAFAGTVYSAVIDMKNYPHVTFIVSKGAGATGTSTITVERCSSAAGADPVAIPFYYSRQTGGDTGGELTHADAAGFTTTAGANEEYFIDVSTHLEGMSKAGDNRFVRLKLVEVVDSPVAGGIFVIGLRGREGAGQTLLAA